MEDPRISARVKAAIDRPFAVGPDVPRPDVAKWREEQRRQRAGHHGVNAYRCTVCQKSTVTIDVDPGATPMMLGCRRTPGCDGMAVSSGYPDTEPPAALLEHLDWEWALPTADEYAELGTDMMAHIDNGGLMLKPRSDRPSAYRSGYWGGISPTAKDGVGGTRPTAVIYDETAQFVANEDGTVTPTPVYDETLRRHQEQAAHYLPAARVVEDDRVPPGLAVPAEFLEPDSKAPRNRAERRAAAKAARLGAAKKADRRISALMATMTPEEIAAANRLADQQLGERRGR